MLALVLFKLFLLSETRLMVIIRKEDTPVNMYNQIEISNDIAIVPADILTI